MIDFLNRVAEEGILLKISDEGTLKLFTEKEEVNKDLLQEIKARKEEIIAYLTKHNKPLVSAKDNTSFIPKVSLAPDYPISDAQKRMWIISQMEEASIAYNIPMHHHLRGDYDIAIFRKAIDAVIARYEILRTTFEMKEDGEIRQRVISEEAFDFSIELQDFRKEEAPRLMADQYIAVETIRPFDLAKGPLLRASLLQLADQHFIFYYNIHHIIGDLWSMELLAKEVLHFYECFVTGKISSLPDLSIQYKDYAAWQQVQLKEQWTQTHRPYWLEKIAGEIPAMDLPGQKIRPQVKTNNGRTLRTVLSESETTTLITFGQEQGGSLFMTLLAVWNILLYRYTGQKDIIIGTPISGRNNSQLENQIGFFLNTLVLRNKLDSKDSFIDFYKKIKINTVEAYQHVQYPFDRLVEDLELERNASRRI